MKDNWRKQFTDEFGIHFKNSSGELGFALGFIEDLIEKEREEARAQCNTEALTVDHRPILQKAREEGAKTERERILAALPQIVISDAESIDEINMHNGYANALIEIRSIISPTTEKI